MIGVLNVFYGVALSDQEFSRMIAGGIAKSLVPIFLGFGCLTVAWLCVALGLWRRS